MFIEVQLLTGDTININKSHIVLVFTRLENNSEQTYLKLVDLIDYPVVGTKSEILTLINT